jgi:hypothetical protein
MLSTSLKAAKGSPAVPGTPGRPPSGTLTLTARKLGAGVDRIKGKVDATTVLCSKAHVGVGVLNQAKIGTIEIESIIITYFNIPQWALTLMS